MIDIAFTLRKVIELKFVESSLITEHVDELIT